MIYSYHMNDPIRRKLTGELSISADYKNNESTKSVVFRRLVEKKFVESIPREKLEEMIRNDLKKVSITPVNGIFNAHQLFHYTNSDFLKDFDFGNTLIQAHIPYCLHFPNHYEIIVDIPEKKLEALVIFEKIWTSRAQTEDKKSDTVDFFAEDCVTYFKDSIIQTPQIPLSAQEGWESLFTGTNIEKMSDQNGIFRFTRVLIQFDTNFPQDMNQGDYKSLLPRVEEIALTAINRVIDVYREVTNEFFIRRLGSLNINLIYFIPKNEGFYLLPTNIETAKINRSGKEIEEISAKLEAGHKPEVYKLLLFNAYSSFETKDYTLAIVESFQSLEIFLENYLVNLFKVKNIHKKEYRKILKKNWKTKDRLTEVLKNLIGVSLDKQLNIWPKWCARYDQTRNRVIHGGKEPSPLETKETLEINQKVIEWLNSITTK